LIVNLHCDSLHYSIVYFYGRFYPFLFRFEWTELFNILWDQLALMTWMTWKRCIWAGSPNISINSGTTPSGHSNYRESLTCLRIEIIECSEPAFTVILARMYAQFLCVKWYEFVSRKLVTHSYWLFFLKKKLFCVICAFR